MKRALRLTFFVLLVSHFGIGQYAETIATGRPGQAIGPRALGAKVFQVQTGVTYNEVGKDDQDRSTVAHTTVLRYGVFERFEFSGVMVW